jgi:hypothetical protein
LVAQGDLVGLGDVVGLDGSQSLAKALASLPQELDTAAVLRDLPLRPAGSGGLMCADRADCGVLITG